MTSQKRWPPAHKSLPRIPPHQTSCLYQLHQNQPPGRRLDDPAHRLLGQAGPRRVDDHHVGTSGLGDQVAQGEAVEPRDIVEVATFLRDSMGFDHAESAGGTDYPKENQIEVIYHLGSYTREDLAAHILSLTARTSRDDARLPTLINVYKSVEYHERETFEMLGVYFEGHPRNERFLLPEDWADIPPLRKDFRIKGR